MDASQKTNLDQIFYRFEEINFLFIFFIIVGLFIFVFIVQRLMPRIVEKCPAVSATIFYR